MSYQGSRGRVRAAPGFAQFRFDEASIGNIQRSVFSRSHQVLTTFNAGGLYPILVDEILPGDTYKVSLASFIRMPSSLNNPIFTNMYIDVFGFFVPSRILWNNWEVLQGAQPTGPAQSTNVLTPTLTAPVGGVATGDLADYMGWPIGIANKPAGKSVLPFRAYNQCVNDWFLDENLQNPLVVNLGDGPDTYTNYTVFTRGKRKDYFTSALPWTQKINDGTSVTIGLGGTAPVIGNGTALGFSNGAQNVALLSNAVSGFYPFQSLNAFGQATGFVGTTTFTTTDKKALGLSTAAATSGAVADLSAATGISINALRQAVQLQRLFERDARAGTRYVEILWARWGVRSPDFRLQRAELLHVSSSSLNTHPVPQTAPAAGGSTPLANLGAFVTGSVNGFHFTKSFVEHGWLLVLCSVRADLTYSQGLERFWSRSTRYDYYNPELAHLGEQAILNQEIYLDGSGNDTAAFGYTARYNEYRYKPSQMTGLMRPEAASNLAAWHLSQHFGALPTLGNTFIQESPPMSRVKAVTTVPDFMGDFVFNMRCARAMPVDGIPGWMDHF